MKNGMHDWLPEKQMNMWPYKAVKSNCVDAIIWFGKLIWATLNFISAMHKWCYYSNLHNIILFRLPLCIVEDLITTILFYRCTTDLHLSGTLSQLWQSAIASQHMFLLYLPVLAQMMQWQYPQCSTKIKYLWRSSIKSQLQPKVCTEPKG